jgi:hypothetical protein
MPATRRAWATRWKWTVPIQRLIEFEPKRGFELDRATAAATNLLPGTGASATPNGFFTKDR